MPGSTTAPNPEGRHRRAGALLLLAALAGVTAVRAADPVPAPAAPGEGAPTGVGPGDADSGVPWLQEVRAQRQAIEERRRANRAAFAAQREAREDRREARRARLERDWAARQGLYPPPVEPPPPPAAPDPAAAAAQSAAAPAPAAPPDWNNVWYFRGY